MTAYALALPSEHAVSSWILCDDQSSVLRDSVFVFLEYFLSQVTSNSKNTERRHGPQQPFEEKYCALAELWKVKIVRYTGY